DLGEVVERFTASAELAGDVVGQRNAPVDQLVAQRGVGLGAGLGGGQPGEQHRDVGVAGELARRLDGGVVGVGRLFGVAGCLVAGFGLVGRLGSAVVIRGVEHGVLVGHYAFPRTRRNSTVVGYPERAGSKGSWAACTESVRVRSTCQPKLRWSGRPSSAATPDTRTCSSRSPTVNRQCRLLSGAATAMSVEHTSSTARRMSATSSRVKSLSRTSVSAS